MQRSTVDPKEISDAKSKAGTAEAMARRGFQEIVGSPGGRKFLFQLLDYCQLQVIPPLDPLVMAMHNGKRAVGNEIMRFFNTYAPASFAQMMKENTETPKVENERSDDDTIN